MAAPMVQLGGMYMRADQILSFEDNCEVYGRTDVEVKSGEPFTIPGTAKDNAQLFNRTLPVWHPPTVIPAQPKETVWFIQAWLDSKNRVVFSLGNLPVLGWRFANRIAVPVLSVSLPKDVFLAHDLGNEIVAPLAYTGRPAHRKAWSFSDDHSLPLGAWVQEVGVWLECEKDNLLSRQKQATKKVKGR